MRLLHWCMLGVTILLLVCEVTVSQLCKSLIILVDGFHTLFILMHMALTPPETANITEPSALPPHASCSSAAPPANLPVESSIKALPGTEAAIDGSPLPYQSVPQLLTSPPALGCGLSYTSCRIQTVGAFISALLLASLCISCILEIISFSLEPHPVQHPLLLVVIAAVSVLHKMLVFWQNCEQQQAPEMESHLEVNHKVLSEEEAKGHEQPGPVLYDVSQVQSAVDDSLHNGALVLCNPGTSSVPDTDYQTPGPQAEVRLHAAAPQDSKDFEVESCAADMSHSKYISKDNTCMGHHGLCISLLALINSLVMLLIGPQCLHSSGPCGLLVYLDPGLSLLAVVALIATATPQVHKYGLQLLQATPPHVCVPDLGRRIASIPGVRAVHDLHIWQLTESFMVASVHVHCHAGFPANRCADLMSGVTMVLQSVGVSCCTVQPELASCCGSPAGSGDDASPVVHREDPSLPPLLACSLACGKACSGNMCCSPLDKEGRSLLAPPAGETKEEPQTLVIENTFL